MSESADDNVATSASMSDYYRQVWEALNQYWARRNTDEAFRTGQELR